MWVQIGKPLLVLAAIPLALIGVGIGFLVQPHPISLLSLVGVVGLTGIVVNDALVLVTFINSERRSGRPLDEAIASGCELRVRPILLTSVTTVAGLLGADRSRSRYFAQMR